VALVVDRHHGALAQCGGEDAGLIGQRGELGPDEPVLVAAEEQEPDREDDERDAVEREDAQREG
jgi:hypothetical protein